MVFPQPANGDWTIGLKPSALVLETKRYKSYTDFSQRFFRIINLATPLIDTDYLTRVGLRYVNAVPILGDVDEFIMPDLVAPLRTGDLGVLHKYRAEMRGEVSDSIKWTLRHGFKESVDDPPQYELDIDIFTADVPLPQLRDLVGELNQTAYDLFRWAIGPRTLSWLKGELTEEAKP